MRRGSTLLALSFDDLHVPEKLVGNFHLHTTEVGNQMCTVGVASDVALGTPSSVFATKGKHVAAMAAPVGADVCDRLEAMRDTMVDLVFVLLEELVRSNMKPFRMMDEPQFQFSIYTL